MSEQATNSTTATRQTTCRSCKQPIRFGLTEKGRRMPIDPQPVPDGNVVFIDEQNVRVLSAGEVVDGPRFQSHFVSCPSAARHRGKTR